MSALDRYQKSGGFMQLLQLIETCGTQKQEKFLKMVKEADPRWSEAIQKKMLTMTRILTWSDEVVSEIAGSLQDLTLAIALHGLDEKAKKRFYRTFSFSQRRKIEDLYEINQPSDADIGAAFIKIFIEVRKLIHEGALRADKVDPDVFVEDGIEDILRKGAQMTSGPVAVSPAHPTPPQSSAASSPLNLVQESRIVREIPEPPKENEMSLDAEELRGLRKKLLMLTEENKSLKQEIHNLKSKIEQIKKLAA